MWYRLGSLVPGFSQPELAARAAANSLPHLVANPLYLPHKLLQYGLISLGQTGAFWMRLPSTLFGILVLLAFYQILAGWYSRRLAILGSFLLLCSAWFLHYARLATPEILLTSGLGLLWAGIRLKSNQPRGRTLTYCSLIVLASLYVPGMIWLIGPALAWQNRLIRQELKELPKKLQLCLIVLGIIGLAPLIYGFVNNPNLIKIWLDWPASLSVSTIVHNAWHLPVWLVLAGPPNPVYRLGQVSLLDSFCVIMGLLGLVLFRQHWLLDRVRAIVVVMLVGSGLVVLNGPEQLVILLAFIYVLVASGIAFLLQQWFTVFPRNPLSRWWGVGLIGLVVLVAGNYQINQYFRAWPHTPATRAAFQGK